MSRLPHMIGLVEIVNCMAQRYVARNGHRMTQASGGLNDLYVSFQEGRALLNGQPPKTTQTLACREGWPDVASCDQKLSSLLSQWSSGGGARSTPFETIERRFDLSPDEFWIFGAALASQISVDVSRLFTFAWADFSQKRPTPGFLSELVAGSQSQSLQLFKLFGPQMPLRRLGLLELRGNGPRLNRDVIVPETIVDWILCGELNLMSGGRLHNTCAHPSLNLWLDPTLRQKVGAALEAKASMLLIGAQGCGRLALLEDLLAADKRPTIVVELTHALEADADGARVAKAMVRAARLTDALLVLRAEKLFDIAANIPDKINTFSRALTEAHSGFVLLAHRPASAIHRLFPGMKILPFKPTSREVQAECWSRFSKDAGIAPSSHDLTNILARRFHLTPGQIHKTVSFLAEQGGGPLSYGQVEESVNHQIEHKLSEMASSVKISMGWDDLILPPEIKAQLEEIRNHAEHAHIVYDEWGFKDKLPYGRGLSCLFSGPPGTGKTMAAGVIAKALRRELYTIDLSRISSKWVGETEKNLAQLFDEAEKAQAILLFDEADSLFSSRTKVTTANDRFANMEINFLLQRMESYDGIAILTTNFSEGIDQAFKRRLRFTVDFPMPDAVTRELLWNSMIPQQTPVEADIDFEHLAELYTMPGGNIKNAMINAAFTACSASRPISHGDLLLAADKEAAKMGLLVRHGG